MKCIDCFVDQRRQWELEHAKPDPIPLPVGRPALNLEKPRIVQGHFSEKKNINVLLHHSSRFSYEGFFHCHDFFEMIYLYRGNCTQRFPDEDLLMSPAKYRKSIIKARESLFSGCMFLVN